MTRVPAQRVALATALVLSVVVAVVSVAAYLRPTDADERPGRLLRLDADEIPLGQPVRFRRDDFFLVRLERELPQGGTDVEWRALYPVTPRPVLGPERGCRVAWHASRIFETNDAEVVTGVFLDPCSGSMFSIEGERLFGPASADLPQFQAYEDEDNGEIVVDTRVMTCRDHYAQYCRRTLAE